MKTQIYLDENGSTAYNHHSNHKVNYDKNFILMCVITIGVLITLFTMFGVKGQTPAKSQKTVVNIEINKNCR